MRKSALILACAALLSACGDKADDDLEKSPQEVRDDASGMDDDELEAVIEQYQESVEAKQEEIDEVASKLRALPPTEMLGEGKTLSAEAERLKAEILKMRERLQVYVDELARRKR